MFLFYRFVEGVLTHYYTSDDDVQKDSELQQWISEIFTKGFLGNQSTGVVSVNILVYIYL